MIARVARDAGLIALIALAACDDDAPTITISDVDVTYAAWRDDDGAWQRLDLGDPAVLGELITVAIAADRPHTVAIACAARPGLWVYTSEQPGPHPPGAADYGCDPGTAALSTGFWFIEPIADDPTCGWAEPRGVCPPTTALPVAVSGAGADTITVVSLRSGREIGRSPTDATLYDPVAARGEQAVTVIATDAAGGSRALTLPIAPRLPLVVPAFDVPPPVAIAVARDRASWPAPVGRPFVELRTPGFAIRTTISEPLAATALQLPIVDPAALPGWDAALGGFAPGASVEYAVDLFDLGQPEGSSRATAVGTLTW